MKKVYMLSVALFACSIGLRYVMAANDHPTVIPTPTPPHDIQLNSAECFYLNSEKTAGGSVVIYEISKTEACTQCARTSSDGTCRSKLTNGNPNQYYYFCQAEAESGASTYVYAIKANVKTVVADINAGYSGGHAIMNQYKNVFDNQEGAYYNIYKNNITVNGRLLSVDDIKKIKEDFNLCPKYLYGASDIKFNYNTPHGSNPSDPIQSVAWLAENTNDYSARVVQARNNEKLDYSFLYERASKTDYSTAFGIKTNCKAAYIFGDPNYAGEKKDNIDANNNGAIDAPSLAYWIRQIMLYIRVIGIALVIGLGVLDFARAMISSKEEQMKKAQLSFVKRIGVCIAIFFIPMFMNLVMHLADIAWKGEGYETCTLTDVTE